MQAIRIKMKPGCGQSSSLTEIDSIYLTGLDIPTGYYKKETVHEYIKRNNAYITVNISPYPRLIPATSFNGEKYVKSIPNGWQRDNLLNLPRD